jgi:probable O-glycosylation ligase (exosortase A-associated)
LSIGFFGVKGGIFTISTLGGYRVLGPEGSFIADNNSLAIALLMVMPLGFYLYQLVSDRRIKLGLLISLVLMIFAIVASYSRGAFLAVLCVAIYFWLKSRQKLLVGLLIIPLIPLVFLFMPEGWHERMSTITEYEADQSAMGRLNAWEYSYNVANSRVTGAGFESWSLETFSKWAPDPYSVHAAHSIYFAVLADHGWIGLLLFLTLFVAGWRTASKLIKAIESRDDSDEHRWISDLLRMIQVSLIAYASGGAFLSLAYFDLPWHLLAIIVIVRHLPQMSLILESAAQRSSFSPNKYSV